MAAGEQSRIWRKFGAKDGIERGTKNGREAGMGTWPLRFELLLFCYDRLRCDDFNVVPCTRSEPSTSALGFAVSQRLRQMTGDVAGERRIALPGFAQAGDVVAAY